MATMYERKSTLTRRQQGRLIELSVDDGGSFFDAARADFTHRCALVLSARIFFGNLAKGFVENWNFVLYAESDIGINVKGAAPRLVEV